MLGISVPGSSLSVTWMLSVSMGLPLSSPPRGRELYLALLHPSRVYIWVGAMQEEDIENQQEGFALPSWD